MMFLPSELPLYYTENTHECPITPNVVIVCCIYSFSRHVLKTCQSLFVYLKRNYLLWWKNIHAILDDIAEQQLLASICQTFDKQCLVYFHNDAVRLG